MFLPRHLQADINDGMNPDQVLAVYCKVCGEYQGQVSDFTDIVGFDEDNYVCEDCERTLRPHER